MRSEMKTFRKVQSYQFKVRGQPPHEEVGSLAVIVPGIGRSWEVAGNWLWGMKDEAEETAGVCHHATWISIINRGLAHWGLLQTLKLRFSKCIEVQELETKY